MASHIGLVLAALLLIKLLLIRLGKQHKMTHVNPFHLCEKLDGVPGSWPWPRLIPASMDILGVNCFSNKQIFKNTNPVLTTTKILIKKKIGTQYSRLYSSPCTCWEAIWVPSVSWPLHLFSSSLLCGLG